MNRNKNTNEKPLYLTDCGLLPDLDKSFTKIVIEPKNTNEVKQIIENFTRGGSELRYVIQHTPGAERVAQELGFIELQDHYVKLSSAYVVIFIKRKDNFISDTESVDTLLDHFTFFLAVCG